MSKPLRIAQMVGNLETGGTQALIIELMRRLDRARFDPVLVHFKGPNHFADEIKARGWRCLKVRASRSYRSSELRALAAILRAEDIQIAHTHSDHANFAGRAAAVHAQIPWIIAHYHNTYEHRLDERFLRMEAHLAPHTDAVVACSKGVEEFVRQRIDLKDCPLRLVQNGVSLEPYVQAGADREGARRALGIPAGVFHIVHTARLEPHKQPERLLHALSIATLERDRGLGDWRLTYVGGGSLAESLKRMVVELDRETVARGGEAIAPRVHFAGWTKDIPLWLAAADVFCLVSRNEGLPLSLVEAMAAGTATIASDVVGPREVIEHERSGLLIEPQGEKSLVEALLRLRHDIALRAQLVDNGRVRAKDFSIERFVREIEALYDGVTAAPGCSARNPLGIFKRLGFLSRFASIAAGRAKSRRETGKG